MELTDHTYRGLTRSLCPGCLKLVDAKIITRGKRVYFRKRCPDCGSRDDFVCSDVDFYDRFELALPGKVPPKRFAAIDKGCPFDCGLCPDHEQHTCVALIELTDSCNLSCPMCFASSLPGGKHRSLDEILRCLDRLVEAEGRPEVVQLSGGEPTLHPDLLRIVDEAYRRPIDYVLINTNGLRLASDGELVERLAAYRDRLEIFLQFDGFDDEVYRRLRGEPLLDRKLRAIERVTAAGLNVTLAVTLQGGVNEQEIGPIVEFASRTPGITSINFQPATYSGRCELPETLEQRVTFPDVVRAAVAAVPGMRIDDFLPLPCAHPNCHFIALAYRGSGGLVPLSQLFDLTAHHDLLANGIAFTRDRAKRLAAVYAARTGCGCDDPSASASAVRASFDPRGAELLERIFAGSMGARDFLRLTITSFLDVYNFDVRRVMKCCTHHVLPSGHVIPFCAYNVLYREGHVALPKLVEAIGSEVARTADIGADDAEEKGSAAGV
ncbi:MAG TPA: radical SAM protein [Planctomycetaceae bacterium]|nr:radical SAM protein [Planctomycetaceae bacterium]HRF02054.1 radical SAM protein [Pirellulaceae bacterium]